MICSSSSHPQCRQTMTYSLFNDQLQSGMSLPFQINTWGKENSRKCPPPLCIQQCSINDKMTMTAKQWFLWFMLSDLEREELEEASWTTESYVQFIHSALWKTCQLKYWNVFLAFLAFCYYLSLWRKCCSLNIALYMWKDCNICSISVTISLFSVNW